MRKKELLEDIKWLNKRIDRYESKEKVALQGKFKDIPELKISYCVLCGNKRLKKDMVEYKRKGYMGRWELCYVCKKCPLNKREDIDD